MAGLRTVLNCLRATTVAGIVKSRSHPAVAGDPGYDCKCLRLQMFR